VGVRRSDDVVALRSVDRSHSAGVPGQLPAFCAEYQDVERQPALFGSHVTRTLPERLSPSITSLRGTRPCTATNATRIPFADIGLAVTNTLLPATARTGLMSRALIWYSSMVHEPLLLPRGKIPSEIGNDEWPSDALTGLGEPSSRIEKLVVKDRGITLLSGAGKVDP
jgi:hypothetical protein